MNTYQVVARTVEPGFVWKSNPASFSKALKDFQKMRAFYSRPGRESYVPVLVVIGRIS